jgi:cob(I)alamin adenosyltransferase
MVVLNKIYTRRGDDGTTALGTNERVPKYALRVAAYGTVDETNAAIGMARIHLGGAHPAVDAKLARIRSTSSTRSCSRCALSCCRAERLPPPRSTSHALFAGAPSAS